ncbi:YafY family transcriptional regulator [Actinoplanes bogorensis]|uniref:YafY family transcriptional regulator n=1 Tax=Paractinoplanes bogorensis TaxID=1610840 RepID=A0ABS5Z5B4_9ACTN|nr:YafY family protein [Actinoplanes bogorensis]MBU2670551.1 YafY family transcriptional regulator [Actinoplanes bogorensis]
MSRPTARVLALLEILQGGGTHTAGDLSVRLGVDERTVRRYADHLLDLEIPIESVRGRYGGYRLAPGFRLPPLMLTDDEALAILLGLHTGRSAQAADSAAAKVRRVLPRGLGARLDALFETADLSAPGPAEATTLLRLATAARDRQPVLISYTSRDDRRSERTLHPYGIVAHHGRWYVTGADSASGEVRTFRLDRIAWVRPTTGTFEVPSDFDPTATVLTGLASAPWRHEVVFRVRGGTARLPRSVAAVAPPDADGWSTVRMRAERLDWLPPMLAGLGVPFVIEKPAELRTLTREWAEQIAAYAA